MEPPPTYESWSRAQARTPGNHRESSQRTTLFIGRDQNPPHDPSLVQNSQTSSRNTAGHTLSLNHTVSPSLRMNNESDGANPAQSTTCDVLVTYDSGHDSAPQLSPHDPWYSSTSAISYLQEGFSVSAVTSRNDSWSDTAFPPHQDPELRRVDYNHPYRQVTELVDLSFSYRIPRATTSITTTVHIQPSSIPMSNGHSPFAVGQAVPGSSVPWPHHLQHSPVPSSPPAIVPASAIGNALESNLAFTTTTTPPPSYPYSDPGVTQNDSGQVWSFPQPSQLVNAQPTPLNTFKEASPTPKASTGSKPETTKKRKVKMHACPMCRKEFPRPSGLHTHMNTHSNAKPYPCTYPGCHRMFGVRSNAKRHLRTHGISPDALSPSSSSSATPTELPPKKYSVHRSAGEGSSGITRPYVVSFHEPIIVGDPISRVHDQKITTHENGAEEGADESGGGDGRATPPTDPGPPFYKVRWLPLSLTSRTSAAALKNGRGQRVDEDQESNEGSVEGRDGSGEESGSDGRYTLQSSYASSQDGSHDEEGGQGMRSRMTRARMNK